MSDRAQNIVLASMIVLGAFVILYACSADALPTVANPVKMARCK